MVTQPTWLLWLLHYCWPVETQDDWNFLSLAASPQCHDRHPCMYSYSRIKNATKPCLEHLTLAAACWAAVVAAAQQWWLQPIGTACHNFQHAAQGCSPVNSEIINTIVLELECVLCQTSGRCKFAAFRRASQAGAAGNKSLELSKTIYRYILVYRSTYSAQTIIYSGIIVCTCIYFISTSYTFTNHYILS